MFKQSDIFRPTSKSEFTYGQRKTILGWLIDLYLYPEDQHGYIEPNSKSNRKRYEQSIEVLRKHARLKKNTDILKWEEGVELVRATKLLNKVVKDMNK